jgi:serine/threonine protein kinase
MLDGITQLGNYRLIRQLGSGGFAEVYLGEHIHLKTQAAIKVLQAQLSGSEREDFIKEAQIIASLVHPHIVRVLEFGIEKNVPFLVMDYAAGGSQRQAQAVGQPLPLPIIVSYVKQVASALQYAHNKKIIHRDVKPENMLLRQRDELLLSDFGIALVAQSSCYASSSPVAAGTISYMAPEQLQGQAVIASDQYSLGIVVYEWLTGERPFKGSYTEVGSQHIFAPPPPLRAKMPMLSSEVENVVLTALAKEPQKRFANVQLFAETFERACQGGAMNSNSATYPANFPGTPKMPSNQPSSFAPTMPSSGTMPVNMSKQTGTQPARPADMGRSSGTQPASFPPADMGRSGYTQPAPPPTFSSYPPPPPPPPSSYPTNYPPPMAPYVPIPTVMQPPPARRKNSGCCIGIAVVLVFILLGTLGSGGYAALTTLFKSGGTSVNSSSGPDTQDASASAGTVLYNEQGDDTWSGWSPSGEWKTLHSALLSDGTGAQSGYSSTSGSDIIWAPHQVGVANYALQAKIQVTSSAQYCYFGLVGRGTPDNSSGSSSYKGYVAGISAGYDATNAGIAYFPISSSSSIINEQQYDPGTNAHTYRVEFADNHLTMKIDNAVISRVTDNVSLDGSLVGLESGNCQLSISNFSIIKL